MEYDILIKGVPIVVGAIGAAIKYFDSNGKRSRMRDDYRFAREFLQDVKHQTDLHPYLREKGYQAIAGDAHMSADEIEYLLSLTRPERALRDYVTGRKYLDHFPQSGNLQINFRDKYKGRWSRQWRMALYLVLYVVSVLVAFAPMLFSKYFSVSLPEMLIGFAFCVTVFGPLAWFALQSGASIYRAQVLVANQSRHTQRIVLPATVTKISPHGRK